MFKFFITKYFDGEAKESSGGLYDPSVHIFTSSLSYVLDRVLTKLQFISAGNYPEIESSSAAIEMFGKYITEAKQSLKAGVAKDLLSLSSATPEKECGVRIASILERRLLPGYKATANTQFFLPIERWLENPAKDDTFSEILKLLIDFNLELNDEDARLIIETAESV